MLNLETADHLRQSSDDGYTEPDLASALSHHAAVVLCLRHSSSGVHHVLAIVPIDSVDRDSNLARTCQRLR